MTHASKILNRLGWILPEIVALTKNGTPAGEFDYAILQRKRGNTIPDGTDLFAPGKDLLEESYETSMLTFQGFAVAQVDALICEIVVEPTGATVELVLNAYKPSVRTFEGSLFVYEIPPGEAMVFTQEDVKKAALGIWIARGMSMEAKVKGCTGSRAAVRLMGWEIVKKMFSVVK